MKLRGVILASLGFGGCANHILVDHLEGRSHLPGARVATLAGDRPGTIAMGTFAAWQNPSDLHVRGPRRDSTIAGLQDWTLPSWTVGGHLVWTPWEGVTLSPAAACGVFEDAASARLGATMGLHADTDVLRWQLEGTAGFAWSRARLLRRTLVSTPADTAKVFLDAPIREVRTGWAPQIQAGIQIESVLPRQPIQLWGLGRWSLLDAALLRDDSREAISVEFVQVAQAGVGFHRTLASSHVLSAGILHGWIFAGTEPRPATATSFVVQWEITVRRARQRTR